jgi:4'-phosphopantetheinyl transferase
MTALEAVRLPDIGAGLSGSPVLGRAEVHLWRGTLEPPVPVLERLSAWLSPEEVARARRFHSASDRDASLAAHGWLRLLLSGYLDAKPGDLEFDEGPGGKPKLKVTGSGDLRFNLAHSGDLVLFAVGRGREVGVDLERMKDGLDWNALAANYFSAPERAAIAAVSGDLRKKKAYWIWTRKEAWIKAVGMGLSLDLRHFDVIGPSDEPVWLSSDPPPPAAAGRWTLRSLGVGEEFAAAVSVEGSDVKIGPVAGMGIASA